MEGSYHDNFEGHDHCAKLTAERDALRGELDALRRAASAVVDRWDTPQWKCAPSTAGYIGELRKALVKEEGK